MQIVLGSMIGDYRVESWLGSGAMADVFRGVHAADGPRALKILRPTDGVRTRRRFLLEASAQRQLVHPNIVRLFDRFDWEEQPVLVLELVDGGTLDQWLSAVGPPEEPRLKDVFGGILRGVAAIHERGLVHRDLKPSNVLLQRVDGTLVPKIADFGLVKDVDLTITATGARVGTPSYTAPEQQLDASRVDARADVFALGCLLYELATGQRAFSGKRMPALTMSMLEGEWTPVRSLRPDASARLVETVEACLQPDRERRPPDARALLAAWEP